MNELEHLAKFVTELRWEELPQEVKESAKLHTLDTLTAGLGATENEVFQKMVKIFSEIDAEIKRGVAVWGTDHKVSLRTAALLNGMLSHILELDDVHTDSKTHIGTVVIPAAWTLAEYLGKSGKEFLEAVVCGYEVTSRIGMGFGVSAHRNRGWHVTGTAGVFGAAAACGKLLELNTEEIVSAFGLAGTQACSTWVFLTGGATHKILHPGRAAASGLDAALLVKAGMKGSREILDAKDGGIYPMMSDAYRYDYVDRELGKVWEILRVDNKPYPCCRSTHCAIDAAISLKNQYKITQEQIQKVEIDTYLVGWKQCAAANSSINPKTATDAKFSTPYVVAAAFADGVVGLGDFEEEKILSTERQEFLKKVEVRPAQQFTDRYPEHWGCNMKVTLKDGNEVEKEILDASGSLTSPLSREQLLKKAFTCCEKYERKAVEHLFQEILELDTTDTKITFGYTVIPY